MTANTVSLREHLIELDKERVRLNERYQDKLDAERMDSARELRAADQKAISIAQTAAEKAVTAALAAQEKDLLKTATATERRFENTNEWRQTYGDLANRSRGGYAAVAAVAALILAGLSAAASLGLFR